MIQPNDLAPDSSARCCKAGWVACAVLSVLVLWSFAARMSYYSDLLPFYTNFDIDMTTTIDVMAIHQGLYPSNIAHPASGMYMILSPLHYAAWKLGAVSFLRFSDIAMSPQPVWGLAELTEFLQSVSIWLTGLLILTLTAIPRAMGIRAWWVFPVALAFFSLMPSLPFNAALIRAECYSIAFWALGFAFAIAGGRASAWRAKAGWIAASGAMAGLCIMTKTQSIVILGALPIGLLIGEFSQGAIRPAAVVVKGWRGVGATAAILLFALMLAVTSNFVEPFKGAVTFSKFDQGFSAIGKAILGALLLSLVAQIIGVLRGWNHPLMAYLAIWINVFTAGFFLSYALHFCIYGSLRPSVRHAFVSLKMLFWAHSTLPEAKLPPLGTLLGAAAARNLAEAFARGTALMLLGALSTLPIIALAIMRKALRPLCIAVLCLGGVMLLNLVLANRYLNKDDLYREMSLAVWALVNLAVIANAIGQIHLRAAAFCVPMMVAMPWMLRDARMYIADQVTVSWITRDSDGFKRERWLSGVYGGSHFPFWDTVSYFDTNPKRKALSLSQADDHARIRAAVQLRLPGVRVDHRRIGAMLPGFPVGSESRKVVWLEFPVELVGGYTVALTKDLSSTVRVQAAPRDYASYLLVAEGDTAPAGTEPTTLTARSNETVYTAYRVTAPEISVKVGTFGKAPVLAVVSPYVVGVR